MSTPNPDLAFSFVSDLTKAIDQYSNTLEKADPNYFRFRDYNLKFAFERQLYFLNVNSDSLKNLYRARNEGKSSIGLQFSSPEERMLGFYLCNEDKEILNLKISKSFFTSSIRTLKTLVNPLRALFLRIKAKRTQHRARPILFFMMHEKFRRYLAPIINTLDTPSAFLFDERFHETQEENAHNIRYFMPILRSPFSKSVRNYLIWAIETISSALEKIRPRSVVLVEGNAPFDELFQQVADRMRLPTICIQQGWSPFFHPGFKNFHFGKMLVWGEGFQKLLEPHNPSQKFVVTGSHSVDTTFRSPSNRNGIVFFLQSPSVLITVKAWEDFLQLIESVAKRTEWDIYVREHPSYPVNEAVRNKWKNQLNIKWTPASKYSLTDLFGICNISASIYSTTLIESACSSVIPVICNFTSMPKYSPDLENHGAGIEVKTVADAERSLLELIENSAYREKIQVGMQEFRKKFFHGDRQSAIQRIQKEILDLGSLD